jgi:hypothetical protein
MPTKQRESRNDLIDVLSEKTVLESGSQKNAGWEAGTFFQYTVFFRTRLKILCVCMYVCLS